MPIISQHYRAIGSRWSCTYLKIVFWHEYEDDRIENQTYIAGCLEKKKHFNKKCHLKFGSLFFLLLLNWVTLKEIFFFCKKIRLKWSLLNECNTWRQKERFWFMFETKTYPFDMRNGFWIACEQVWGGGTVQWLRRQALESVCWWIWMPPPNCYIYYSGLVSSFFNSQFLYLQYRAITIPTC